MKISEKYNILTQSDWNPNPIDIKGLSKENLISTLLSMTKIRKVEQIIASKKKDGFIKGPVHLGIGQEAIAAGVSNNLNSNDKVFGGHRSHAHLLALGSNVYKLFAELLGKPAGHSMGMGGSMHLIDKSVGFCGSVPIVSGTVPLAVGASLACKMKNNNSIAVSYLGDGALEEGVVHESLNLASLYKLPIIFVIENNLFASHMHISLRQPNSSTTRFAKANNIPFELVDGNNVIEIANITKKAILNARSNNGPFFLEAITYRWNGHVDWRDDIDVGIERSSEDLKNWKKRDPIRRLLDCLIKDKLITEFEYIKLTKKIISEIELDWERALSAPDIEKDKLLSKVFSENNHYDMDL